MLSISHCQVTSHFITLATLLRLRKAKGSGQRLQSSSHLEIQTEFSWLPIQYPAFSLRTGVMYSSVQSHRTSLKFYIHLGLKNVCWTVNNQTNKGTRCSSLKSTTLEQPLLTSPVLGVTAPPQVPPLTQPAPFQLSSAKGSGGPLPRATGKLLNAIQ